MQTSCSLIKPLSPDFSPIYDSCPISLYYDYCNDSLISLLTPHLLISILLYVKIHPFPFLSLPHSFSLVWTNGFIFPQWFTTVLSYLDAYLTSESLFKLAPGYSGYVPSIFFFNTSSLLVTLRCSSLI